MQKRLKTFYNRDGLDVYLAKENEAFYFCAPNAYYFQIRQDENGCILSVDPNGGPMFSKGDELDGNVVCEISKTENHGIFKLKIRKNDE